MKKISTSNLKPRTIDSTSSSFIEKSTVIGARIFGVDQAADYLGITEKALRSRIDRRELPFFKIGRRIFFSEPLLDGWVNQHLVTP